jgi:hypothetical protein
MTNGSTKSTQDPKKNSLEYPKVKAKQSGPQDMHITLLRVTMFHDTYAIFYQKVRHTAHLAFKA